MSAPWVSLMITCGNRWTPCGSFFLPVSPLALVTLWLLYHHHNHRHRLKRKYPHLHQYHDPSHLISFICCVTSTFRSVCISYYYLFLLAVLSTHFAIIAVELLSLLSNCYRCCPIVIIAVEFAISSLSNCYHCCPITIIPVQNYYHRALLF